MLFNYNCKKNMICKNPKTLVKWAFFIGKKIF